MIAVVAVDDKARLAKLSRQLERRDTVRCVWVWRWGTRGTLT